MTVTVILYDGFRGINVCRRCWAFACDHGSEQPCEVHGCDCTTPKNPVGL